MQTTFAPFLRLIPRDVSVICGSKAIRLNFIQHSAQGDSIAETDLPYELATEAVQERVSEFRFRVARLRYEASHS